MATRKEPKFAKVLSTLEKAGPTDLDYQGKIDVEKERFRTGLRASNEEIEATQTLAYGLRDWQAAWDEDGAPETHTPESLAKYYIKTRQELDQIEEVRYARQVRLEALEQMLVSSYEASEHGWGLYGSAEHTVKLASGACIDVQQVPDSKVEDKEAFRLWCIKNGLEQKLQLWPSTMAAISSERLLAGQPPPDGVTVKARLKIKYRKA